MNKTENEVSVLTASMRGLAALEVDKFFANMFCQVNGEILYFFGKAQVNF